MNSKNTWLWFLLAGALFATLFFLDRHWQAPVSTTTQGWPDFQLAQATSVQVIPAGAVEIRADRTNDQWFLTKPYPYPAQPVAIQALLDALAKLTPVLRITAGELRQQPSAEQDYGLDNPPVSLFLQTRTQQWQLKIGRRTAPGNQVYMRVVGVDGAFVTEADWLKYLPQQANDWRDRSLVNAEGVYDWIVLTNGAKVIELRQNHTNHLWQMIRPLAARADSDRINRALQQLRFGRVEEFVTEDAHADLPAYELQPADLDLWLGHAGVLSDGLHLGKSPTNNPALVFAKREGWNGVVTTLKEPLSPWHGTVNEFRNAHLVESAAAANELEVRMAKHPGGFTLQRQSSNVWQVAGESFPVDTEMVQNFLKAVGGLSAKEYVDSAATTTDLEKYGLTQPGLQITLRPVVGDTNQTLAQLAFSAQTNGVFVRRSDEDFIYRLDPADLNQLSLYDNAWQFRDRQIWNFPNQDITQITVRQNGKTRQILHSARDQWVLAPGSAGEIYGPSIEETAHQLGTLAAIIWVQPRVTNPGPFGVDTNSLHIEVGLKNGQKLGLDVGNPMYSQPVGLVTLNGERWAFVVPEIVNQLVVSYLTIPANVP
jgi:hypothetical protein